MKWINDISNNDNIINKISIEKSNLIVNIELWNGTTKQIIFFNYYCFKEKNSIGKEIGDIILQEKSSLLSELKQDAINCNDSVEEFSNVKSIAFYDSWNNIIFLEVLAEHIELK